ncbi:hypothetical protein HY637_02695 [Candidatus Woesearchaeota archaeon]|nr:hypothetical protein [Candidatus Woesearchaeota archaeon]
MAAGIRTIKSRMSTAEAAGRSDWRSQVLFPEAAPQVTALSGPQSTTPSLEAKVADQDSLGLIYDHLKVMLSGPERVRPANYRAAEFLYYGANDLERLPNGTRNGLPEEFYAVTTKAERAALFIGDGRLKYNPDISMHQIRERQLESMSASQLVSIFVGIGWGYQGVREIQKRVDGCVRERGGLIAAIDALPPEVQDRIKSQLLRSRAVSQVMNNQMYDFPDTNAERVTSYTSAKNYLEGTAAHMKRVQEAMRSAEVRVKG